ncbi:hypothetical protein ACFFGH_16350 [Lysobacter korlensis]|uniref:7-cyano-7-deazaguanine synthase n=1 Tax=Lysobacter korlensis TaxID=553636 RepID=A0ABV6RU29_9GAMM
MTPIYLVDDNRGSLQVELRTMDRIRERLAELHPYTRELMRPTLFARVAELQPDAAIDQAFNRLAAKFPIGSQYNWLARFCRQRDLKDVEIGFERERYGAGALLLDLVEQGRSPAGYPAYRIPAAEQHTDVGTIFGSYVFPLFDITKQDMAREVDARGWRPIMLDTWFCHRPVGTEPCGRCHPCLNVIKAGLGWRIPPRRRALGALHRATIGFAKSTAKRLVQGATAS